MSDFTDDYALQRLGPGTDLSTNDYKFGTSDRDLIARLLRRGAETHHHDGALAVASGGVGARALDLTAAQDAGAIPAGSRVFYRFTLVDTNGFESEPSDAVFVDTPSPVSSPAAPTLSAVATGGALLSGNYYYVLTAWVTVNTQETKGITAAHILVPVGTSTNVITVDFPTLPTGADGFNVYRKQPGGIRYDFVTAIDMTVATPPSEFVDDGTIAEDCNRTVPTQNFTNAQNHVVVDLTGDALPVGTTWRLYRTYVDGDYAESRIAHVTSGTQFDDLGLAGSGSLPLTALEVNNPDRILLTNGAEVQGTLPPSMVAYPVTIEWTIPGLVATGTDLGTWRCPYDAFLIDRVRLNLAPSASPAATDVIVDVNRYDGQAATPGWGTIFTTQANRPTVPVGEFVGANAVPDVVSLNLDDLLAYDVDQDGGGATPNDYDLVVQIVGWAFINEPLSVVFP